MIVILPDARLYNKEMTSMLPF